MRSIRSRTSLLSVCAAAAIGLAASQTHAVTIYAMDNLGPTNASTVGDRFIRFNSTNPAGTVVTVGATGVLNEGMSGLDFTNTGALYSVSGFNTSGGAFAGSKLYSVNVNTGAATLVGSTGLASTNAIADISWNPVTQQMLAVSNAGGGVANLYTLNLGTGAATLVGPITGLAAGNLEIGLASNSAGVNYVHNIADDRMYVLAGTVATPLPSTVGVDTNFSQGMVIDWQSGAGGQWFLGAIGSVPAFFSQVMTVNAATGAATTVAGGLWPIHAANGLPEYETGDLAIPPVPEPGSLAALGMVGLLALRRRGH